MYARRQRRPVLLQLGRQFSKLGPGLLGDGEVGSRKGMFLERNKVQAATVLRIGSPGLPGGEEVEAETEARFENDETVTTLPALWQVIAAEKNVACLRRAAVGRMINIVIGAGKGRAVGAEVELGRLQLGQGASRLAQRTSPRTSTMICTRRMPFFDQRLNRLAKRAQPRMSGTMRWMTFLISGLGLAWK